MENNINNSSSNQNRSWEDNNYSNQDFDSTASQQQNQSQENWSSQPYRSKLPADPSAMVLAIIATVLFVLCCCFGGPIISLILTTIGFILAHNSVNKYKENAGHYDPNSFKKVNNAKIFNLVVGVISLLVIIISLLDVFDNYSQFGDNYFDDIFGNNNGYYEDDSLYEDSETEDDWYEYEEEVVVDSLNQETDSLKIEAIEEVIIEEIPQD